MSNWVIDESHPVNKWLLEKQENANPLVSALKNYATSGLNYTKGAITGSAQALGDIGSSIGNFGISGIEHLIGKKIPHIPHPALLQNPQSLSENIGQSVGQTLTPLIIPGFTGLKAAKLVRNPLGKLATSTGIGAFTGAAEDESNRGLGALMGGASGLIGAGAPIAQDIWQGIRSKNIAKNVMNRLSDLKNIYGKEFNEIITKGQEAGANRFLKYQPANISLLKKGGDSKLVYALQKYNNEPSLSAAHDAQKDMNKIINKLKNTENKSTQESDKLEEAIKIKNRLLKQIHESFNKSGTNELSDRYHMARQGYKNDVGPYLESNTINKLKKGNLREKDFADELLQEKKFLAKAGEYHPSLIHREIANKLKKSNVAKGAALSIGAAVLPYGIYKYFK
jgi:hypothetical protein